MKLTLRCITVDQLDNKHFSHKQLVLVATPVSTGVNFLGIGFSMATGAGGTAIQQKASAGIDLLESDWMAFRRDWYRVFTRSHAIGTSVRLCRYGL